MSDPSSITSVTEEEESNDSDTTETSYSKASDGVSSVMYSSECNTDDKLTTSLVKISISKNNNSLSESKKRPRKHSEPINENEHDTATTSPTFPYGSNPLPLERKKQKLTPSQAKKKQKSFHSNALTKYVLQKQLGHQMQTFLPRQEEENFGIDDPNNYLYTDFSDTSSVPWLSNEEEELDSVNDEDSLLDSSDSNGNNQRPFLPDMSSDLWFQARCFDQYWSHYSFVMEWYRQHVQAVNMLSTQFSWSNAGMWTRTQANQPKPKKKNKSKRAKNRARNRRLAKAKHRAAQAEEKIVNESSTAQDSDSNPDGSELEMEITEDMMDFFTTSFKHRMERDHGKAEESNESKDKRIEKDGVGHSKIPSLLGPSEQPGVRRTAEMKTLYGFGAPMIHGMETALQMTYDKVLDRHKPKLWPNMPLKINFA